MAAYNRKLRFISMTEVVFTSRGILGSLSVLDTEGVVSERRVKGSENENHFSPIKYH